MVIWITGLSGAGKTTLCNELYKRLKPEKKELLLLDGDKVRAAFGHDLSHKESDRIKQVKRLQAISQVLSEQNLIVIVAVLYNNPELLLWNRNNLNDYYEIYLDASLELVKERDNKGLYAAADTGEMIDVVGLDIPWHEPKEPHLKVEVEKAGTVQDIADKIISSIPKLQ